MLKLSCNSRPHYCFRQLTLESILILRANELLRDYSRFGNKYQKSFCKALHQLVSALMSRYFNIISQNFSPLITPLFSSLKYQLCANSMHKVVQVLLQGRSSHLLLASICREWKPYEAINLLGLYIVHLSKCFRNRTENVASGWSD
jgi:hypothetical protein